MVCSQALMTALNQRMPVAHMTAPTTTPSKDHLGFIPTYHCRTPSLSGAEPGTLKCKQDVPTLVHSRLLVGPLERRKRRSHIHKGFMPYIQFAIGLLAPGGPRESRSYGKPDAVCLPGHS